MNKILIPFFGLILIQVLSCTSNKSISGTYRSRFATHGVFGTTVRLKSESKLEYIFQGDLIYDSATGNYLISDDKVYLKFDKEVKDSNRLYYRFDEMPIKTVIHAGDTIRYQEFCYVGKNKLFPAHFATGAKVTKARGYSKRKKYIFFGSHYFERRYYYKRIL